MTCLEKLGRCGESIEKQKENVLEHNFERRTKRERSGEHHRPAASEGKFFYDVKM
jgi:hypothetical protein